MFDNTLQSVYIQNLSGTYLSLNELLLAKISREVLSIVVGGQI
jgi:hypothetical protein